MDPQSTHRPGAGEPESHDLESFSDDQPTVISDGPPALLPTANDLHPTQLGRHLEGERLGHYELVEFIGGGGMGAVFRSQDTMLNRTVAVKVLASDQAGDEETHRRFKNEAQSAARLDHENIARVHYVGEDRGVHYIVFEHIEGVNVRDLVLSRGPLPWEDAISYTLQIAEALAHAHQRDVVHRDIKPSNVLVTYRGRAKLVDMGLARLQQEQQPDDLTASGVTLGTFDYISPEQARDPRSADVRSDLYSLGCTLYFMLTAEPPFPEGNVFQKVLKHQGEDPPDPREKRSDLPNGLVQILLKLLAKSPAQRYQRPEQLIHDLRELCERCGLKLADSPALQSSASRGSRKRWIPADSPLRRHLPWVAAVVALVLCGVVLDSLWSSPQQVNLRALRTPSATTSTPANQSARSQESSDPPQADPHEAAREDGRSTSAAEPRTVAEDAPANALDTEPVSKGESPAEQPQQQPTKSTAETSQPAANAADPAKTASSEADSETAADEKEVAVAASTAKPPRSGVLVVSDSGAPGTYATLQEACAAAADGEIVELQFSGVLVEEPITIDQQLTIRAPEPHQPTILFRPKSSGGSPFAVARHMLTVSSGQLAVKNVELMLDLPDELDESWALVACGSAARLDFDDCLLTVRNANHGNLAVIELLAPQRGSDRMGMPLPSSATAEPVRIDLDDCVVRGEANFLRSHHRQSVELTWHNGLLAISQRFADFDCSQSVGPAATSVRIELQYVTAVCRRGLLLAANRDDPRHKLMLDLWCDDNLITTSSDAPLIETAGFAFDGDLRQQLSWQGHRNLYHGPGVFWRVTPVESAMIEMDAAQWSEYWASRGREASPIVTDEPVHVSPPSDQPFHNHVPLDYAIQSGSAGRPARDAADDGGNIGCRPERLPAKISASSTPPPRPPEPTSIDLPPEAGEETFD